MGVMVSVELTDRGKRKLSSDLWENRLDEALKELALMAEDGCKKTAPYRTGNLRRSHSTKYSKGSASIHNSTNYWVYVVFGTRYQKPQNYPAQVVSNIKSSGAIGDVLARVSYDIRGA